MGGELVVWSLVGAFGLLCHGRGDEVTPVLKAALSLFYYLYPPEVDLFCFDVFVVYDVVVILLLLFHCKYHRGSPCMPLICILSRGEGYMLDMHVDLGKKKVCRYG